MKTALAGFFLALSILAAPEAQSQASQQPNPRLDFSLDNSHVILRSMDGTVLPLDVSGLDHHFIIRTYNENTYRERDITPLPFATARAELALGAGFVSFETEGIFGNMRATTGFSAPSDEWATNDFMIGANAVFTLPPRSFLTMTGWVTVRSTAAWDMNYMSMERGLISASDGAFGERYILSGSDASSQYFMTAINPLDEPTNFYYYSNLFGVAFNVTAVPEPSHWLMLVAGLILLTHVAQRQGLHVPIVPRSRALSR